MFKFMMLLLATTTSALVITPAVGVQSGAARASPVVMGAKKTPSTWNLADFLSSPMQGRELLNGSAPDRKKSLTPEEYDTRRFKAQGKVDKSSKINPKDASTW